MKHNWEAYRLGDFLERQFDRIELNDIEEYKRLTIRGKGQGIQLRDKTIGFEIGTKKQYFVKENQFLLSKIDARNGAFGIVPKDCDGGIITGNFWTYNVNNQIIEQNYLDFLCLNEVFTEFSIEASEGTTNRKYLREDAFLDLKIPLPPLSEQQRIVAKIESIKGKIEEIQRLRAEQEKDFQNLLYSYFNDLIKEYGTQSLREGINHRKNFIQIDDTKDYMLCRVQTKAQGIVLREIKTGWDIKTKKQQVCKTGDFLVAEMDARFGGYGIVPKELEGAIVSSHYFLYEFKEDKLRRKYLDYYCKTNWFHSQVEAKGSTNYAAIRPHHVLDYQIPLPPLSEQNRIVAFLEKANAIQEKHKQQEAALTELLPSLLDKAFKGEL